MRLLDRILSEGFKTNDLQMARVYHEAMSDLGTAQLVVIDNVAEYYHREMERRREFGGKVSASDFPNVMVPFSYAFFDMRPSTQDLKSLYSEVGVLTYMIHLTDDATERFEEAGIKWDEQTRRSFMSDQVKCFLVAVVFVYNQSNREVWYLGNYTIPVDKDGRIVCDGNVGFPWISKIFISEGCKSDEDYMQLALLYAECYLYPACLALSFMHCRNVKIAEERPPEKLSKKHRAKTGKPLLKYRVLQIDHMKEVLEREGGISKNGLKRALHICRGHFSRYGQDGKGLLFGKYAATVWVPMHTRGSKVEGIVVKDYSVK
jgi:hypothetical protein